MLCDRWVVGELALGHFRQRQEVLGLLTRLPQTVVGNPEEALLLVEREQLVGLGIGYVDVHLLAAARLTSGARLWTGDRRLAGVAARLGGAA